MRTFGHCRAVRNEAGEIVSSKPSPVRARCVEKLGAFFGTDKKHRLIVTLAAQDLIELRPEKTQRVVSIKASDLYAHLLRCAANGAQLAKARDKKERKAVRLAAQRQQRAERRLTR